ncbi:MFS transporter [Bacillus sp. CGMCC 1.16541]|uniref:MFS transporter n=1 Tax=Bacillus sp. CGMCC 1.16541 TaxID=2185143 RepID=UPI000D72838C|nr:MFS transporter [Bacillus sp. CGMCC 1.16541]
MNKQSFRFLWIGQSFANAGDILYIVGLMATIYAQTGAATYMALVPLCITMARFVSSMIAPLLLDTYSLKKLLAYSQLGKTCLSLVLVLYASMFLGTYPLICLFLIVIGIAFLDGWASPARNALIPQLVDHDQLIKANGFLSMVDEVIRLGGWAASGLVVALIGSEAVLWLTVVLFIVSTVMMFWIDARHEQKEKVQYLSKRAVMKEGWVTIWQTPSLRLISSVQLLEAIANVVWIAAIVYVYVEQVLKVGEQWWGYINASFALGCMVAGIISLRYDRVVNRYLKAVILLGAFVASITTLSFGVLSKPWLALILSFLFGVASVVKGIAENTIIQTSVDDTKLSKVYAAQEALLLGAFGTATVMMGYVTDLYGARFSFTFAGVLLAVGAVSLMIGRNSLQIKGVESLQLQEANDEVMIKS